MSRQGTRFVLLTRMGDPASASILAARLQSEGIEVRVHSPSFGPYPVTVGELAQTEVWVLEDRLDEACSIALDSEINHVLEPVERVANDTDPPFRLELRIIAFVIASILAMMWVMRFIRVF